MRFLKSAWRRFREERGNATIEFIIIFPSFMLLFLSAFEIGIYTMRSVMLERSLDIHIRSLRLGTLDPATPAEFKRRMCNDMFYFDTCEQDLSIDVRSISSTGSDLPTGGASCRDRVNGVDPGDLTFAPGPDTTPTLLRACLVMDPFFGPTPFVMDLPQDASGGMVMIASSTYVAEP